MGRRREREEWATRELHPGWGDLGGLAGVKKAKGLKETGNVSQNLLGQNKSYRSSLS